jgi:hydroxyacylglutathione hydrolase
MKIDVVPLLQDNFAYVLHEGTRAAIIDPSEARPVIKFLNSKNLKLELILCTHHHQDHVGGIKELSRYYQCPTWASKWDLSRIDGSSKGLEEKSEIKVLGEPVQILHIPGHTSGAIGFYLPNLKAFFSGDTLFSLGCGRLFEGTPEEMFASLHKVMRLPDDTQLYFGHEYTVRNGEFTRKISEPNPELETYLREVEERLKNGGHSAPSELGREKRLNPFLNTESQKEWTKRRNQRNEF